VLSRAAGGPRRCACAAVRLRPAFVLPASFDTFICFQTVHFAKIRPPWRSSHPAVEQKSSRRPVRQGKGSQPSGDCVSGRAVACLLSCSRCSFSRASRSSSSSTRDCTQKGRTCSARHVSRHPGGRVRAAIAASKAPSHGLREDAACGTGVWQAACGTGVWQHAAAPSRLHHLHTSRLARVQRSAPGLTEGDWRGTRALTGGFRV